MNFLYSKRGCIFSFLTKSEGFLGKNEGYLELAFIVNCLIYCLLITKVKK